MTSEKLFDGDNGEHITLLGEEEEDEDEQETNANDEFHVEAPPTGQTTWRQSWWTLNRTKINK